MPISRFALDEDVAHHVAGLLRYHGLNADSAKDFGRLVLSDTQVLLQAAEEGQTLVTHNSRDFRALHEAWVTWRRHWMREVERAAGSAVELSQHAGIVITPHLPIDDLARILEEFANGAAAVNDRLFAWSRSRLWHEPRP